jgi:nitrogen fixation/metabolism regulation signal transduction histidine kinase
MDLVRSQILFRVFCFSIPFVFVIVAFCIVFTHRIAGPITRLELTIDRFLQGEDVEDVQLRKEDDLKGLTQKINDLIRLTKDLRKKR